MKDETKFLGFYCATETVRVIEAEREQMRREQPGTKPNTSDVLRRLIHKSAPQRWQRIRRA